MTESAEDDSELTFWKEVCWAHEFDLQRVRAENARLRKALEETCHALEAATAFHYAKGGFPFRSSKQTLKQARAALEVKP